MSDPLVPIIEPGRNCWLVERAARASVIVDAADYYHVLHEVMSEARSRILIVGWDFDTRISLEQETNADGEQLGEFVLRLADENPQRRIAVLKWSFGALRQFVRPSALWMLIKWKWNSAIDFRLDSAHPTGCSHHQKLVVIDDQLAVCGGIDIAAARWDTSEHRDGDPRRRLPDGAAYEPWHDITMMMQGPVAGALAELGRDRWAAATSVKMPPVEARRDDIWPDDLPVDFTDVDIAIARTRAAYGGRDEIREIEVLYLDMIAAAKRFIYMENQYLTSAKIAEAIAARMKEANPPDIVLVMPRTASGWLEQRAMDAARVMVARAIGEIDSGRHFRIYVPVTQGRADIYVHAKVAIVDDRFLRIGSSNLNNRSLGLDSECDVVIDAALEANHDTPAAIGAMRTRLLSEHLAVPAEEFARHFEEAGSLIGAIEALRGPGRTLEPLDLIQPGALDKFIAENELLDPEHADGFFEPLSRRGLRRTWMKGRDWRRARRRVTSS